MAASLEKLDGLQRRLTVTIPAEQIEEAYAERLKKITKTAKISGFRPGKVPVNVLEKRYSKDILHEVANELMQSNLRDAVQENKLEIAGLPKIEPPKIEKNKPLTFVVSFETYPNIDLKDLKGTSVERCVAKVTDKDVDGMLEQLRKQHAEWHEVNRAAQEGDRVVVDFEGSIDDKPFERGNAKDFQLELGSKRMIAGFEEGIVGAKADEERDVTVSFPKDYPAEELAGKKALFKIKVHKIMAAKLPPLDDALAKKTGFEKGIQALSAEARKSMEQEIERVLASQLKVRILDKLIEMNPIDVPQALVETEIDHLQKMTREQMASQGQSPEEVKKLELPREPYVEQAKKRVQLGLLLGEVIKQHEIKVNPDQVRAKVEEIATAYQKPEEVVSWYYNNKRMLSEIESVVLEDQAVAKLQEQLEVEDKQLSYEEALKGDPQK